MSAFRQKGLEIGRFFYTELRLAKQKKIFKPRGTILLCPRELVVKMRLFMLISEKWHTVDFFIHQTICKKRGVYLRDILENIPLCFSTN